MELSSASGKYGLFKCRPQLHAATFHGRCALDVCDLAFSKQDLVGGISAPRRHMLGKMRRSPLCELSGVSGRIGSASQASTTTNLDLVPADRTCAVRCSQVVEELGHKHATTEGSNATLSVLSLSSIPSKAPRHFCPSVFASKFVCNIRLLFDQMSRLVLSQYLGQHENVSLEHVSQTKLHLDYHPIRPKSMTRAFSSFVALRSVYHRSWLQVPILCRLHRSKHSTCRVTIIYVYETLGRCILA